MERSLKPYRNKISRGWHQIGLPYLYCGGHGENTYHRSLLGRGGQQLAVSAEAYRHHSTSARHHFVHHLEVQGIVQDNLLAVAQHSTAQ